MEATENEQKQRICQLEFELAEQKRLVANIKQSFKTFTSLISD